MKNIRFISNPSQSTIIIIAEAYGYVAAKPELKLRVFELTEYMYYNNA